MAQGSCHSSDFSTAIPEEHLCLSVYVYVRVYNTHYLWMLSIRNHMLTITVTVTVMVMVMVMVTVTATVMLN